MVRTFTTDLVPSLLQLPDYAKAALHSDDPVRRERQAAARAAWSRRLDGKDPLTVRAVFPESVLRLVVGGRQVMRAQLLHLMEMSELDTVSIKIIPHSAGAYPAMGAPFTLLSFAHRLHNDVAYFDTFLKGDYVEDPSLTEQCVQRFTTLSEMALGGGESVELIAEAAAEL